MLKNKQIFIPLSPRPNVVNLFMAVIYECSLKARVFVPGKPFQPSLIFVSGAKAYPREAPFRCSIVGSTPAGPYSQTLGLAGKAHQGQTL
jgi:hypothetical protein